MLGMEKDMKRKVSPDEPVSPPPLRRKVQSATTKNAVASFFTPTSQKVPEKERVRWQERAPDDDTPSTLLIGTFEPENSIHQQSSGQAVERRRKIAAFDLDSTLIQSISGKKHASEAEDWRWWHLKVPEILRKLYKVDGYLIAIITNQAGLSLNVNPKSPKVKHARLAPFKKKVEAVLSQLDIPISLYAATEKDINRKPRIGMWKELLEDKNLVCPGNIDLTSSFFVGDAAGRVAGLGLAKDFASSDRDFAANIGIKFHTPEEFFLQQAPRNFRRAFDPASYVETIDSLENIVPEPFLKRNKQDIVMLCGSPGAGKSTFFWTHLQPLNYERINQDILKSRDKCLKVADGLLSEGKSVAIDNTNADREVRSKWVKLATGHNVPIRCVLFLTEPHLCEHNDAVRALNKTMNPEKRTLLPKQAFTGFGSRFQQPELAEGFQDITKVSFKFRGTDTERETWARYWT